jgi:uncharacterized protein (TIRG00374 family)
MMTEVKSTKGQRQVIMGIVISLAALGFLIRLIDGSQVLESLQGLKLTTIIPVLVLLVISLLTRAAAWRVILREKISVWKSFLIVNSGYFVNTVFPFRIGEIARAFLLLPSGFVFWQALPTILLERLFDFGFALGLFFIGLPFAVGFSQGVSYAYLISGGFLAGIIALYLLVRNQQWVVNWIDSSTLIKSNLKKRLLDGIKALFSSLGILTDALRLVKVFTWMLISWSIALIYQYLLLRAFVPDGQLIWAVFTLGTLALGVSIPSSPGNIGLYEASITLALSAFGVDQSVAFAYALTSHFLSLLVTTLLGSFGLVREGFGLRDIWLFSREQKKDVDL